MGLFDNAAAAQNKAKAVKRPPLKDRLKGVKNEMKKVVWPTKQEMGAYTVAVIAVCIFFAIGFWLVDLGVLSGLRFLLGIEV